MFLISLFAIIFNSFVKSTEVENNIILVKDNNEVDSFSSLGTTFEITFDLLAVTFLDEGSPTSSNVLALQSSGNNFLKLDLINNERKLQLSFSGVGSEKSPELVEPIFSFKTWFAYNIKQEQRGDKVEINSYSKYFIIIHFSISSH